MLIHYIEETFQTLRQHKTRNLLTGFGIGWALFIFVLLSGLGEGLQKGFFREIGGLVQNSIRVRCWNFEGGFRGFSSELVTAIPEYIDGVEAASLHVQGWRGSPVFFQGKTYDKASIVGVNITYDKVKKLSLDTGRFFNERDENTKRPVCVIGTTVNKTLFGSSNPLGKFIRVNGSYFQVVGTLESGVEFNESEQGKVLIPAETAKVLFNWPYFFYRYFQVLLKAGANASEVEEKIKTYLAKRTKFDPNDDKTHFIGNISKRVAKFNRMFITLRLVLLLIGFCLLLSGVIGISNMMLMAVRERTKEIGIRKVIGAKSREIMLMIISETIIISIISGCIGMLAGIAGIAGLNQLLKYIDPAEKLMIAPLEFKWPVAIGALIVLLIAGVLAGVMPAKRATAILPIKALNTE